MRKFAHSRRAYARGVVWVDTSIDVSTSQAEPMRAASFGGCELLGVSKTRRAYVSVDSSYLLKDTEGF